MLDPGTPLSGCNLVPNPWTPIDPSWSTCYHPPLPYSSYARPSLRACLPTVPTTCTCTSPPVQDLGLLRNRLRQALDQPGPATLSQVLALGCNMQLEPSEDHTTLSTSGSLAGQPACPGEQRVI